MTSTTEDACPFCAIIAGRAPGTVVDEWTFAFALLPLDPVVDGHTLIIPQDTSPGGAGGVHRDLTASACQNLPPGKCT